MATQDDHVLAADLAAGAGALLLEVRGRLAADGAPAAVLKDEGDRLAHAFLMDALAAARPDDAVLSEEGSGHDVHPDRATAGRTWIIDPLDGTREFGEPQRTDWAVHVALAEHGLPTAGAVALPGLDLTLSTPDPPDASSLPPVPPAPRVVVSRTRPPGAARALARPCASPAARRRGRDRAPGRRHQPPQPGAHARGHAPPGGLVAGRTGRAMKPALRKPARWPLPSPAHRPWLPTPSSPSACWP